MNVHNLAPMIDEMKAIPEWPNVKVSAPHMLLDIFESLAIPEETFTHLMGEDTVQFINHQINNPIPRSNPNDHPISE
jgi:hypothetical protein